MAKFYLKKEAYYGGWKESNSRPKTDVLPTMPRVKESSRGTGMSVLSGCPSIFHEEFILLLSLTQPKAWHRNISKGIEDATREGGGDPIDLAFSRLS